MATDNDAVVGHCELVDIDLDNRSAHIALVLVDPECRGQGFGQATIRLLLEHGFETLGLHRIGLYVFDFNVAAIACYQKCGFSIEGTLREARRVGDAYWNLHVMGILATEWQPNR